MEIGDDVLAAVRELASLRGLTMGEVLTDLARLGLERDRGEKGAARRRSGVELLPPREGAGIVTTEHVNALLEESA